VALNGSGASVVHLFNWNGNGKAGPAGPMQPDELYIICCGPCVVEHKRAAEVEGLNGIHTTPA